MEAGIPQPPASRRRPAILCLETVAQGGAWVRSDTNADRRRILDRARDKQQQGIPALRTGYNQGCGRKRRATCPECGRPRSCGKPRCRRCGLEFTDHLLCRRCTSAGPGLNFEEAGRRKEEALDTNEASSGAWLELIRGEAVRIAGLRISREINADDLRKFDGKLDTCGIRPRHFNCWGSIFRGPEWEFVRYTKSARIVGHQNTIRVWRLRA